MSPVEETKVDHENHTDDILVNIHIDRLMGIRIMEYCILQNNEYNSDEVAD